MAKYSNLDDTIKGETKTVGILLIDPVTKTRKSIPLDKSNRDYQEYLEWVKLGNTPDPYDSNI
tara:strand:+ start:1075 stop:1263 length:189 start_codon:yes stop_codon:yes gene_type:complete